VFFVKYNSGDKNKENKLYGVCGLRGEEKVKQNFRGNSKERQHFENLVIHGRTTLKNIFKKEGGLWTGFIWLRIGRSGGFSIRLW